MCAVCPKGSAPRHALKGSFSYTSRTLQNSSIVETSIISDANVGGVTPCDLGCLGLKCFTNNEALLTWQKKSFAVGLNAVKCGSLLNIDLSLPNRTPAMRAYWRLPGLQFCMNTLSWMPVLVVSLSNKRKHFVLASRDENSE